MKNDKNPHCFIEINLLVVTVSIYKCRYSFLKDTQLCVESIDSKLTLLQSRKFILLLQSTKINLQRYNLG